eukprot:616135-Pyramimonas_sp.AAC.1
MFTICRWSVCQQIAEAHPCVEHSARGNRIRKPRRDIVFVKRRVAGGCSEPLCVVVLIVLSLSP